MKPRVFAKIVGFIGGFRGNSAAGGGLVVPLPGIGFSVGGAVFPIGGVGEGSWAAAQKKGRRAMPPTRKTREGSKVYPSHCFTLISIAVTCIL